MPENPKTAFFSALEYSQSDQVFRDIEDLASRLDGCCFFGAGAVGRGLLWHFGKAGIKVPHFIDNNPRLRGQKVEGLPVLSLDDHLALAPTATVVLTLARGFRDARAQCRRHGIEPIPQYLVRSHFGLCPFGKRMPAAAIERDPAANAALAIWADTESARLYRTLVRFQALFDDAQLPPAAPGHYFSPEYMPRQYLRSVVDIGACDGDTLADFLNASGGDFTSYHAFEADPSNFARLAQTAPSRDSRVTLHNMALGDKPGTVRMRSLGTLLSNIGDDGDVDVPIDTLDHVLGDGDVTLIKIDVEGYEPQVMAGMEGIVRCRRPALAISVYHQVDHLWSLPLWIRNLDLGYSLRLACHSDLYSEAVCYAAPPS